MVIHHAALKVIFAPAAEVLLRPAVLLRELPVEVLVMYASSCHEVNDAADGRVLLHVHLHLVPASQSCSQILQREEPPVVVMLLLPGHVVLEGQHREMDELQMELIHRWRVVHAAGRVFQHFLLRARSRAAGEDLLSESLVSPELVQGGLGCDGEHFVDECQTSCRILEEVPQVGDVRGSRDRVEMTGGQLQHVVEAQEFGRLCPDRDPERKLSFRDAVDKGHEDIVVGRDRDVQGCAAGVALGQRKGARLAAGADLHLIQQPRQQGLIALVLLPELIQGAAEGGITLLQP
mmetsp:Transcript_43217/g.128038  ORF Transcript_43217/g.128038 Transcript_43217/m.128038 type:complete len:291 (-) Transcript_43217:133-1005(-)